MTLSVLETTSCREVTLASGLEVITNDLHHWLTTQGSSFYSQQFYGTQWGKQGPTRSHVFVAATHVN